MKTFAEIVRERTAARLANAQVVTSAILRDARNEGLDFRLIGSLQKGDFQLHSDIDLVVMGETDLQKRVDVERVVAKHMKGSDLQIDLIFASDLTPEKLRELMSDNV